MEKRTFYNLIGVIAVLSLVIIGLSAYVFIDFRTDSLAADAEKAAEVAGMDGSARFLRDDILAGDKVLAYHHASEAAEHAYRFGDSAGGIFFDEIASAISDGKNVSGVAAQLDGFLAGGVIPSRLAVAEESVETIAHVDDGTRAVAEKFFGVPVLHKGETLSNGAVLYSRSNAYAVIDGDKCVPIEAAVSLPEGEGVLTDAECVTAAMKFLADFFPTEVVNGAAVTSLSNENGGRRCTVGIRSGALDMTVTVRRDTGRVVRFIGGRE